MRLVVSQIKTQDITGWHDLGGACGCIKAYGCPYSYIKGNSIGGSMPYIWHVPVTL